MILEPECIGCLLTQVVKAFELLKPDDNREEIIEVQKKLMEYLLRENINECSAPIVGGYFYGLIADKLGTDDPYKSHKKHYNELALSYYDEVKQIIANSEDPIFEAIIVSALGNTVDFASQHEIDLINDIKNFSYDDLVINDYPEFKNSLKNANHLLIIGDNCGEIVFDKILIETLKNKYPDLEIVYAVRSIPIINDATIEDAKSVGLTNVVKVIESSPIPGVDLERITEEFRRYFYSSNTVILSKGQGNFECLHGTDIGEKDLYYLLKAKCGLMERIFGVKKGSLIFKKRTRNF